MAGVSGAATHLTRVKCRHLTMLAGIEHALTHICQWSIFEWSSFHATIPLGRFGDECDAFEMVGV